MHHVIKINKMKNIVMLVFTLTIISKIYAQNGPHPAGSYVSRPNLDKFVGTWQWVSGADTVKVVLAKQAIYAPAPMDYTFEALVGWHRYVKNGVEIESSLQYVNSTFSSGHYTLFGSDRSSTKLYFTSFEDLTKNKECDLYFNLVAGSLTQATWKLTERRGLRKTGYTLGFTLPNNITLTKQ
jgi:hypothetical protein